MADPSTSGEPTADPTIAGGTQGDPPADPPNDPNNAPADPPSGDPPAADPPKDPPADPPPEPSGGKWYADDWREKMAGGDEKLLQRLQRFTKPDEIFKSFQQAEKKISEGGYKRPLPDNPTEEELASWRQENGVPEKPDDYELELGDGLVVGEVDEPYLEAFKKAAHEANMPQQYVNAAAKWYLENRQAEVEEATQQDNQFRSESIESLRDEWGKDYKLNLSMIDNFMEGADDDLRKNIFNARLADGTLLGDNPEALKFLAQKARESNPTATVLNTGQSDMKGVEGRIAELEKYMREDRKGYNKDQKAQEELMKLYDAREQLAQRK